MTRRVDHVWALTIDANGRQSVRSALGWGAACKITAAAMAEGCRVAEAHRLLLIREMENSEAATKGVCYGLAAEGWSLTATKQQTTVELCPVPDCPAALAAGEVLCEHHAALVPAAMLEVADGDAVAHAALVQFAADADALING